MSGQITDEVLLRDGTIARIRGLSPADRDALVALHEGLSERSRYLRFFHLSKLSAAEFVDRLLADVAAGTAGAFVATIGDQVVGLSSYIETTDAGAEIAFAVADDVTGKGLGTILLERLSADAERRGITTFSASVLAENRAMLQVLRLSGFTVTTTRDHETVEVRFPVHLSEAILDAIAARERRTDAASIGALLSPGSVAVIGAGRRPGNPGNAVVANLLRAGYTGKIYPVNPNAAEILGLTAYPSVLDLPESADLAVVATPAATVPDVVDQCVRKGVGDLVILSSGFAEEGPEGRALQNRVLEIARSGNMRVVGPNCLGIANTDPAVRLDATFAPTELRRGSVGLMTQSGGVGIAALQRAAELGIGLSCFVSAGNKADVSGNDMLMYWDDDDRTRVIALYLESFGNPRKFSRLARHISARKPIVALVGGTTAVGRRAAAGHTAGAVTSSAAVDALFRQCGVIRVHTLEQLLHTSSVLANQPLPRGRRVAIVSNGGGPGVLAADACGTAGLELASLDGDTTERIREIVPAIASATNPVDLGAGVDAGRFAQVLDVVGNAAGVDAVIAVHTPVPGLGDDEFTGALKSVAGRMSVTTVAVMLGRRGGRHPVTAGGVHVPVLGFPEDAARALAPIVGHVTWRESPRGTLLELAGVRAQAARDLIAQRLAVHPDGCYLDADDTRHLLDHYGIDLVPGVGAMGAEAAVDAANWVGYPVVMKVADPNIVHKTDVGGVRMGLTTPHEVRQAYAEMPSTHRAGGPAVLVQHQVDPGPELIAGVVQDDVFGPLVMCGYGGTGTEVFADRTFRLTPLTTADAATAIRELRTAPLLFGHRGAPPADVAAVEDLLVRLGRLADDLPEVAEIDLNPVIVHQNGIAVVDAKVRIRPRDDAPNPALPRLRPAISIPQGAAT